MGLKKCPFCAEEIQIDARKCRFCGEFLDPEDSQRASSSKFDFTLILCLCGAALLVLGVFMPAVSLPIVGSMNLFRNGQGDGAFFLLVPAAAIVFGILRRPHAVFVSGLLALSFLCFEITRIAHFISALKAKSDADLAGNPFRGLADIAFNSVELQWGWVVLFVGAFFLVFAGARVLVARLATGASQVALIKAGAVTLGVVVVSAGLGYGVGSPFGSARAPSVSEATTPPSTSKATSNGLGWQVSEETNEMDGNKSATLILEAETEIEGLIRKAKPHLVLRCKGNSTDAYVSVQTQIQNEYGSFSRARVRLRFDEREPIRQSWLESTDGRALFAPQAVPFIKQLAASEEFRFEFTPFQQSETTVRFKTKGLADKVERISKPCGWDDESIAAKNAAAAEKDRQHKNAWPLHLDVIAEGDSFSFQYEIDGQPSEGSTYLMKGERKHVDGRKNVLVRISGASTEDVKLLLNGKRISVKWFTEDTSYGGKYAVVTAADAN